MINTLVSATLNLQIETTCRTGARENELRLVICGRPSQPSQMNFEQVTFAEI